MPPMRATRLAPAAACLLTGVALLAGCGGGSGADSTGAESQAGKSRPAPPKSEFPSAQGRTLRQVLNAADGPAELVVAPEAVAFYPGQNRYPFDVFERKSKLEVPDAEVALYLAKAPQAKSGRRSSQAGGQGGSAEAEQMALDQPAVGPFPASIESLAVEPRFRANDAHGELASASVVYSTHFRFPGKGEWRVAAILEEEGKLKGTLLPSILVGEFKKIPEVGGKAPLIHTPTAQDVGGSLSKISTRIPPDTQNKVDFAEVLGKEPVLLLFASPRFCQSRACGPVVDVAEQAKREYGDKAAFIHMEIYNDNDPEKGVRRQVRDFHLPSEPWLFAIDRRGIVRDAVEGGFGLDLMRQAVRRAISR